MAKWRRQFVDRRLDGLYDQPRVGTPRPIADEAIEAVIVKTLETTPPGDTYWSTRSMAQAAGLIHSTIGRIWRTFRPQPNRTESFTFSPDPQLVNKLRDVVALYTNPPTNAVVFAIDEKSQIQGTRRHRGHRLGPDALSHVGQGPQYRMNPGTACVHPTRK